MARDNFLDTLRSLLTAAGVPYSVETTLRCVKIRIAGRLVQTVPRGARPTNHRADANALANVRRAVRHYQQETVK